MKLLQISLAAAVLLGICPGAENGDVSPLTVTLEQARGDAFEAVDAARVFKAGDEVRLKVRSRIPGYLYVLNKTANSGSRWIYPAPGTQVDNRVSPRREYVLPDGEGAWKMPEKPGFEVVYVLLTSVRLPALPDTFTPPPSTYGEGRLLPRCSEGPLRARGECVDESAGARQLREDAATKAQLSKLAREAGPADQDSRNQSGQFFIYELRLAHQ